MQAACRNETLKSEWDVNEKEQDPRMPAPVLDQSAPGDGRWIEKSRLADAPGLADRLAAAKGDVHQDGVLLDLWPLIYYSDRHADHIHVLQDGKLLFLTRYVGAPEREAALLNSLLHEAAQRGAQACYLDMSNRRKPHLEEQCGLLSTPLGMVQTIDDLRTFSIEGGRMRRLRYLVSRFGRENQCRIDEYTVPSRATDSAIREVMRAWSQEKGVVNKVDAILSDMRTGNLLKRYRIFLTYLGDTLQNVIVLSHIPDGYITDQEYFLPGMPLGGTEYAYVDIMRRLAAEGCRKFSLGLTWGLFEPKEGFSDLEGWALINRTQGQLARIFERGVQNHQYKNKYGPSEYPLYLYRSAGSRPQIIKQCMGQFFRNGVSYDSIAQQVEADERAAPADGVAWPAEQASTAAARSEARTAADAESDTAAGLQADIRAGRFDATAVDVQGIQLDLISDSWAHQDTPFIRQRLRELHEGLRSDTGAQALGEVLGLPHVLLTTSGRSAERVLFTLWKSRRRTILQNIPFFSTLHNEVKAGFKPRVLPDPRIDAADPDALFRGGLDLDRLSEALSEPDADAALVLLELANNGSGGYPVSLAHLRAVSALCRRHGVPLALDITRIVRNAELIRRHEAGQGQRALWDVVAEIIGQADIILGSLCKDFGVTAGGLLATRDERFMAKARRYADIEGAALDRLQARLVNQSLHERDVIGRSVAAQLDLVQAVHQDLLSRGVPLVQPAAGHCLLVRADQMAAHRTAAHPAEALLRQLYETHGVRGGVHLAGDDTHGLPGSCVRLALPLGLEGSHVAALLGAALGGPGHDGAPPPAATPAPRRPERLRSGDADPASGPGGAPARRPAPAAATLDTPAGAIAIIGMTGRYAQAGSLSEYWQNLRAGRSCITEVPQDRWNWRDHFQPDVEQAVRERKSYGKWGGFLEDFDKFDPQFFWMPPRRIEFIDPQERLFLEECWKALEDAGYPPHALTAALRARTGVFSGAAKQGFSLYASEARGTHPHTSSASMVGRVSHFFDLQGPSVSFDNHCASSLVAVHEACEYLRQHKGDLALAGGVSLSLHPSSYVQLSLVQMLSHNEHSAAFGKGGAGYVPGEGVGVVILKRLDEAVRDGDFVHAVIRGGAVNHSGRTRYYGQPSQGQQAAAIRAALAQSQVEARSVSYIEAAASGVEASDAVEMAALTEVFGQRQGVRGDYWIGSVKPAIGHCEAVSGMSQLARAVLSLRHGLLTPTLLPEERSPHIDFEQLPFRPAVQETPWQRVQIDGRDTPRRAGVTTLGNGINAHLIVEEFMPPPDADESPAPAAGASGESFVFALSAQSLQRLQAYARHWIDYLQAQEGCDLHRIAYTLQVGRQPMPWRLALRASDQAELIGLLTRWLQGDATDERIHHGHARRAPEGREAHAASSTPQDIAALAAHWTQGLTSSWITLHRGRSLRKIGGLPSYPFEREAYGLFQAS